MKKFIILIITISIVFLLTACDTEGNPDEPDVTETDSFEIFLATNESVREFGYYDYANLLARGEPVITGNDIRNYFWQQHIIELNGSYMQKINDAELNSYDIYVDSSDGLRQYAAGGSKLMITSQSMCFIIAVNGENVYSGTFPSGAVLAEDKGQILIGDLDEDKLAVLFSGEGFDVRNNDAVYEYFKKTNKLSQMSTEETAELVEELQIKLAEYEINYNLLKRQYDELTSGSGSSAFDKEASVKWLQNRIELYMIETQEGSSYESLHNQLLELDMTDVNSVSKAADSFRQSAVANVDVNDRMFNMFEEFYKVVIEGIPLYNDIDDIDDEFKAIAEKNWIIIEVDRANIIAYPDENKLRENFGVFLSPQLNDYLLLTDLERANLSKQETLNYVEDGRLMTNIDDVSVYSYLWKKFSKDYPYTYPFNFKARFHAEYLLNIYIGKTELFESPLYEEETLLLNKDAKESYERFIEEYTDSPYHSIIKQFYDILESNDFVFAENVDTYINNVDLSIY